MGGTSTTTQTNSPPDWTKEGYNIAGQAATDLYKSGIGGQTYQGSTVAPLSDTTMSGINQLAQAGQSWDTSATRPLFGQLGAGAVSNPYMAGMAGTAAQANDVYQGAQAPSYSEQNLAGMADGSYLRDGNPYFDQALQGQLDKTAAQVQSSMSGAGRYGSGANTNVLTNQLGNIRSNALYNQFNQDTQNMLAANGQMDTARNANDATALNALGLQGSTLNSAGNMYSTGIGQGMQAAQGMAGLDQQNFQNQLTGAGATLQAGGMLDNQGQKQLTDYVNQWYQNNNEDWNRLGMLESALSGASGNYGEQQAKTRTSPGIGDIAGAGATLMGK